MPAKRQPPAALVIRVAGRVLELHAQRAVHWRRARTLIMADPHFGKAAAFRSRGVPVPEATTAANLDRLTQLIVETSAKRLIVLGDFFHALDGRAVETLEAIAAWRRAHRSIQITLVRGNHDFAAGDPPCEWGFHCVDEPMFEEGFCFRHTPAERGQDGGADIAQADPTIGYTFAGHLHPGAKLRDVDGSAMRVPAFFISRQQAILPAFGAFTGLHVIRPRAGDRVFAIGPEAVIEVATRQTRATQEGSARRRG